MILDFLQVLFGNKHLVRVVGKDSQQRLAHTNKGKKYLLLICLILPLICNGQSHNSLWCFGDSSGINFTNLSQPSTFTCPIKTRGSCVSICDTNTNLLFYAHTRAGIAGYSCIVKNKNYQPMPNGSNIIGGGWYMELMITPNPGDANKYYLFTEGVTSVYGFYYSVIDMTLDSGRGDVTQKNIQLLPDPGNDGLTGVRHGNGRDWWILHRKFQGSNNIFYKYLVTPNGVSGPFTQNIGSLASSNALRFNFNKTGDKLAMVSYEGIIETFDFERCSGLLSNHQLIRQVNTVPPWPYLWSCDFSPDSRFLYVATSPADSSYLIQIDLQNSQPWITADTLWSYDAYTGPLKRGPDDKIYFATPPYQAGLANYPFPDSLYTQENMNLSVINSPDSLGAACDFQPWSFYLGGHRVYWGLPNNPDYDMGPVIGSACDTLRPVVNFAVSDTNICGSKCISFSDSSARTPNKWQWFFPGAVPDTSTQKNPSNICYNSVGSYDVKLIACNEVGCDTLFLQNYIHVYSLPVVALGNDTSTCNVPVQLDAGAGFVNYLWSNGETAQMVLANLSSLYSVIVSDTKGCSNSDSVFVTINALPVVSFNAFNADTICITHGIQIINNGNPTGGNFLGVGVSGNTFDPTVAGLGLHYITYEYTDSLGCIRHVTDSVIVDLCAGISSLYSNDEIKIYPNPATNTITIQWSVRTTGTVHQLGIYDIIGKQLKTIQLYSEKTEIDIADLSTGNYVLKFFENKNLKAVQRLVKLN